ncbi:MAG TPA: hypothetical protein VK822_25315 [Acetobacteraceae bacterium]|jgi:hypothetical protein|nr:hypothetical protein [Acetobacteraceae bacterium]
MLDREDFELIEGCSSMRDFYNEHELVLPRESIELRTIASHSA